MFEVRQVLRLWLGGKGLRAVAQVSRVDRKTVRRYVDAAIEAGVTVDGGVDQLTDEVLGRVVEIVRPHRADGHHGEAWAALIARRDQIAKWVKADVVGVKICELLARDGVVVPQRTMQRLPASSVPAGAREVQWVAATSVPQSMIWELEMSRISLC